MESGAWLAQKFWNSPGRIRVSVGPGCTPRPTQITVKMESLFQTQLDPLADMPLRPTYLLSTRNPPLDSDNDTLQSQHLLAGVLG